MTTPPNPEFVCALRKSPPDPRDWKYQDHLVGAVEIPTSLDLRGKLLSVRNQGSLGTCAAFAGAAMKEWQERVEVNYTGYFSPWFIYLHRDSVGGAEGMYLRNVMQLLQKKGVPPESEVPYHDATMASQISSQAVTDALLYVISNYAQVYSVDELKTALVKNGVCLVAVPIYNYSTRPWKQNAGDSLIGGHAMAVCGYDSTGFLIRNSWGITWGSAGYTTMPYEDFKLAYEFWSSVDAPTDPNAAKKVIDTTCCVGWRGFF